MREIFLAPHTPNWQIAGALEVQVGRYVGVGVAEMGQSKVGLLSQSPTPVAAPVRTMLHL